MTTFCPNRQAAICATRQRSRRAPMSCIPTLKSDSRPPPARTWAGRGRGAGRGPARTRGRRGRGRARWPRRSPATLFGSGKVEELKARFKEPEVEPCAGRRPGLARCSSATWKRNGASSFWTAPALILEIFADRARTREGVLQVELAALSYQRTRLVRAWTHLERQRGGFGFVGGPGETQIEGRPPRHRRSGDPPQAPA